MQPVTGPFTGDVQLVSIEKSANFTAALHGVYLVTNTCTVTDPGTPAQGHEYTVILRNGTATIGGTGYSTVGSVIRRIYHSGAWTTYEYPNLAGANTWTAAQTFNGNVTFGGTPSIYGASGAQQLFNLGVGSTQRWAWIRDTANNLLLYRDMTGVSGSAGTIVTVDTSGNLGIGTTNIGGRLNVGISAADTSLYYNNQAISIYQANTTANNMASLDFRTTNGNSAAAIVSQFTAHTAGAASADLVFLTANAASAASERMRVTAAGNVIIGTDPGGSEKLRVGGSAKFTGKITTVSAVPGSFADLAAVRTWLAANFA